jgi:hypothetical protein
VISSAQTDKAFAAFAVHAFSLQCSSNGNSAAAIHATQSKPYLEPDKQEPTQYAHF